MEFWIELDGYLARDWNDRGFASNRCIEEALTFHRILNEENRAIARVMLGYIESARAEVDNEVDEEDEQD
jgi:hypothetical protein